MPSRKRITLQPKAEPSRCGSSCSVHLSELISNDYHPHSFFDCDFHGHPCQIPCVQDRRGPSPDATFLWKSERSVDRALCDRGSSTYLRRLSEVRHLWLQTQRPVGRSSQIRCSCGRSPAR